jgi:hypothetical protein
VWAEALRYELRERAGQWAHNSQFPSYRSLGTEPTVLFESTSDSRAHGNFLKSSWRAIQADPAWARRLMKPHPRKSALPEARRPAARELDSSNSSDALLMNCFCCPQSAGRLLAGLGLQHQDVQVEFGFMAKIRLKNGTTDATEIDMKVGSLLVEAKLTEKDFTTRPRRHVESYLDFEETFVVDMLPRKADHIRGYQLIRNVLAARQVRWRLCVLIDQRRPDLIQEWWLVHAAIRDPRLRGQCEFRTWQQVRAASPAALARFLIEKYGL